MSIVWTKEERFKIGKAVLAARAAGSNETDAAAQAAVELLAERVLPDDALKHAWESDTYADVKALVATLQAKVEEMALLMEEGTNVLAKTASERDTLRAEVERLKAEVNDKEVARALAARSRDRLREQVRVAESSLAAIREKGKVLRERQDKAHDCRHEKPRNIMTEPCPDCGGEVTRAQLFAFVNEVLEGDAPKCGRQTGRQRCPLPAGHEGECERWPQPSATARHAPQEAKAHDIDLCVCYRPGGARLCKATNHPCSPTCTHDDAATPGHPERVKERSEAFKEAVEMPDAKCYAPKHINCPCGWDPPQPCHFPTPDGEPTEAAWKESHELQKAYDRGAEAMRAACLETVTEWARRNQYLNEYQLVTLKGVIEGAAP